mgnify:CR=1 FL=1
MKISKKQLNQIIKEEIANVVDESLGQKVNRKVLSLRKKAALEQLTKAEDANLHETDPEKFAKIEANYHKLVKAWQETGARAQIQKAAAAGSDVVEGYGPDPRGASAGHQDRCKSKGGYLDRRRSARGICRDRKTDKVIEEAEIEESFSTDQWGSPKTKAGEKIAKDVRTAINDPKGKAKKGPAHNPKWHGGKY